MSEKRTVAPVVEPVTLAEAKAQCNISTSAYDSTVTSKLQAAREWVENYTGRALVAQTWRTKLDRFPQGETRNARTIFLNHPPLQSVTSISYVDTDGASQTLASAAYTVDTDSEPGRIAEAYGYDWPDVYDQIAAVTITSVHGYDGTTDSPIDVTQIPQALKDCVLLLTAELYQNREVSVLGLSREVNDAAVSLLWPYRAASMLP